MSNKTKFLFGAIFAGSLAYLIPLYFGQIWLGYFLLLSITVGYLVILFRSSREELESSSSKKVMMVLTGLLILSLPLSFLHHYSKKDDQKERLMEIRRTLETAITKGDVQKQMIHVLADYHDHERESIIASAKELMPEKLGKDGVYISDHILNEWDPEKESLNYYYELDEAADELRVIAVSEIAPGEDPNFENYDGHAGMLEISFKLNNEGAAYEIRN